MGNAFFKEEFDKLNNVVTGLINDDNLLKNKFYTMQLEDICDKYTVVLESQLKKHVKVELQDLKDSIYLIPHANHVDLQSSGMRKDTLCKMISSHYRRILELLLLIKYVYDLEHNGDKSMAGTTIRNVRVDDSKVMEISYCLTDQHFGDKSAIDLRDLTGFEIFAERFLDATERESMLHNLRMLLGRRKKARMAEYLACGDSLISGAEYNSFLGTKAKCDVERVGKFQSFVKARASAATKGTDYDVKVKPGNPPLHFDACAEKRIMLIDLKVKTSKQVLFLYEKMQSDYVKNINAVLKCLLEIVEPSMKGGYTLRNVDTECLNRIKVQIKKLVAKFYFQSIANFHALMDVAKAVPHYTLGQQDHLTANK